ncbi:MAG: exonuclease SbcCD subunit D [Succiniclasticum sp.]|jgi:DNA repair protein SbcD/Mre11
MRILHTADWHLGRIFHGLSLLDDQRDLLHQVCQVAKDERVDAVVVAGDVYDRALPPTDAVDLLDKTLSTFAQDLNIPVLLIAGNHDNAKRLEYGKTLFASKNIHFFGSVTPTVPDPVVLPDLLGGDVYFVPLPFCDPLTATQASGGKIKDFEAALCWERDAVLAKVPAGARKVALAHAFVAGAQASPDSERPLAIGGTANVGLSCFDPFQYTALGHLHAQQHLGSKAAYSGSLMKYSFNEYNQKKGVILVDLAADGSVTLTDVPLTAPHDLDVLRGSFQELIQQPDPARAGRYLQITLTDREPILDVKAQLERVYPHVLSVRYEQLQASEEETAVESRQGLSDQELFRDFFQSVNGVPMNEQEEKILQETLNEIERERRRGE